jgi:hypothetical protein
MIHLARGLHAHLIHPKTPVPERARLARQIEGALFSAEASASLSNRARIIFFRLRTHAHLAAEPDILERLGNNTLWLDYDELALLIDNPQLR